MKQKVEKLLLKNYPDRIAGLSCFFSKEQTVFQIILFKKIKGSLEIEHSFTDLKSLEEVLEVIPKQYGMAIAINGRGVIHKSRALADQGKALTQVFPNIQFKDFLFQEVTLVKEVVVSVVKRQTVMELVSFFSDAHRPVVSVDLGAFSLSTLYQLNKAHSQLSDLDQAFSFSVAGTERVGGNKGKNSDAVKVENGRNEIVRYSFDGLDLEKKVLCAASSAIQFFLNPMRQSILPNEGEQRAALKYGSLFQKAWPVIAIVFLGILVLNTWLYFDLKSDNDTSQIAVLDARNKADRLEIAQKELEVQRNLFTTTGINQMSAVSFYADQIGASLPKEIDLKALNIFPMKGKKSKYKRGEMIQYDPRTILIDGICTSNSDYINWMESIESKPWVEKIVHLDYKDINAKQAQFKCAIHLAELDF